MKRYLPFAIIALVAIVTMGIATTLYRAKTKPAAPASVPVTATPAEETSQEPEDASLHVRGPRKAPVTMEVYGDFQCPSCASASNVLRELEKQYEGRLRVIFYEFPLAMHNHATEAARAAEAAAVQGRFWEMHDALYQYQAVWSKASNVGYFFESYAEMIGLDVARFRADRQSPDIQARVVAQGEAGVARGVKNTPTIFVNGIELRNSFAREKLQEAIETALSARKSS